MAFNTISLLTSDPKIERTLLTWLLMREDLLVEISSRDWRLLLEVLQLMTDSNAKPGLRGILSAVRFPGAIGKLLRSCPSAAPLVELATAGKIGIDKVDSRDDIVTATVRPSVVSSDGQHRRGADKP